MQLKVILLTSFLISCFYTQAQKTDTDAIRQTLNAYKQKIEQLDTTGIIDLFTANSNVVEQGKDEGTISQYLQHHLGPELKEFNSFKFQDYKVKVELAGNYAFARESYIYIITLKDNREIRSAGLSTSVLQIGKGKWKIAHSHSSFRKIK